MIHGCTLNFLLQFGILLTELVNLSLSRFQFLFILIEAGFVLSDAIFESLNSEAALIPLFLVVSHVLLNFMSFVLWFIQTLTDWISSILYLFWVVQQIILLGD